MIRGKENQNDKSRNIYSRPMFSVIIAAYNRARLIERAIKSLLMQTETDWEGIIVDDGSTDGTYSVIAPYLEGETGIRYFRITHGGESRAKNYGIGVSEGRYITFLDSDDEYHPDHLSERRRYLAENPGVMFLYGGVRILGNQFVPDRNNPSAVINLKDCVIGGTFIIERDVLAALEGFRDILLGPDSDLFQRAVEKGIPMAEIDKPTYIYHHENPNSITNVLLKKKKGF
ncbi:MAG TPA: glycosyltransferase family A protein [Bacteroidales bacterium]|nr:glycosyltransferase family A protein [Bacteroidales bacterium]